MREAVIVSAVRTPVGKANRGAYKDVRPEDLGKAALQGALARVPQLDPAEIDDVIVGCAMPEGQQGLNMGRIISVYAGLPVSVPAETVNRFCSSGLQTIAHAAERIMSGMADVIVAGGVESMSAVPMSGHKPAPHPGIVSDSPSIYTGMGNTAETVATRYGIDRTKQDQFAVASHQKALKAIAEHQRFECRRVMLLYPSAGLADGSDFSLEPGEAPAISVRFVDLAPDLSKPEGRTSLVKQLRNLITEGVGSGVQG